MHSDVNKDTINIFTMNSAVLIPMGAEYLSYVKSIATFAPTFYGYTIFVLASVLNAI